MPASDRFTAAARLQGIEPDVRHFPAGTRTAADAADAVGCQVGQIVKSLVFVAGDQPVLVLAAGVNRVDEHKIEAVTGRRDIAFATAEQVRDATGFAIGGTPPFGHPSPLLTIIDEDLLDHPVVWAAAGTPDTCFPIEPHVLVATTGGRVADIRSR